MEKLDYIIVGSGIAGLHTAYRLKQLGKKVLVLEKESYIGGRMSSHLIEGKYIDFGAKFIASMYKNMLPLAKELGVKPVPIPLTRATIRKNGKFYKIDGSKKISALLYKGLSLGQKLRLGFAVLVRLFQYRKLDFYKMDEALYLDDKSIYEDFRAFAGPEAYEHTVELFSQNIVFYPTKEFSCAAFYPVMQKLIGLKPLTFPEGIGQLCQNMAAQLPVELDTEVKKVGRKENEVRITAKREGRDVEYAASNAILAVPGNRVLKILSGPSAEEREFFSKVDYAGIVQILCKARTNIFSDTNVIEVLPRDKSSFTALGKGRAEKDALGFITFIAALKQSAYLEILKMDNFNPKYLEGLIVREFPQLSDLKVIRIQV